MCYLRFLFGKKKKEEGIFSKKRWSFNPIMRGIIIMTIFSLNLSTTAGGHNQSSNTGETIEINPRSSYAVMASPSRPFSHSKCWGVLSHPGRLRSWIQERESLLLYSIDEKEEDGGSVTRISKPTWKMVKLGKRLAKGPLGGGGGGSGDWWKNNEKENVGNYFFAVVPSQINGPMLNHGLDWSR